VKSFVVVFFILKNIRVTNEVGREVTFSLFLHLNLNRPKQTVDLPIYPILKGKRVRDTTILLKGGWILL
jgi:hypothetical protein